MSVLNIDNSLILIIDIQEKLLNAVFNKDILRKQAEILAKAAKILEIPCVITEQYPKGLGNTVSEITKNVSAYKIEKISFNALENEKIYNQVMSLNKTQVILAGIETHICVRQTAEALIEKDFEVSLLKNCCGSRSESEHIAGIDIMKQEGCLIKTTEMVLFELLKSATHPKFKEIQALIK